MKQVQLFFTSPVKAKDLGLFLLFTVLVTFNPCYLNDRINVFELGLYLPGINAIEHGLVPYRDFFHLRGPVDLYLPLVMLKIFGYQVGVLNACFFFGNVICLLCVVLIAKELIQQRYMFYLMIPPIIARTFPRVVFPFWGGLRYVWGFLATYCIIKFFKSRKFGWLIASGVLTAVAALTSIEMGVYVVAATGISLCLAAVLRSLTWLEFRKAFGCFVLSALAGGLPWLIYSISQGAFMPYVEDMWTVVTRMQVVIDPHNASIYPHNFQEAFHAMTHPSHVNFKHMTPSYTYLALIGVLLWRGVRGQWRWVESALLALGVYGFIMYNTNFRGIWTAHFEMALMPQKILYFYMIETFILWVWGRLEGKISWMKATFMGALIALLALSWGYALARFHNRFWSYQYLENVVKKKKTNLQFKDPNEHYQEINLRRAKGFWVPVDQAEDLNQLEQFIDKNTKAEDTFVMFPELGMYHFLFDRPFLGRFPITTFSWFNDSWFEEYLNQLRSGQARYIVLQKKMSEAWDIVYLGYRPNIVKYAQMLQVIKDNYRPVAQTLRTTIYQRKP